MLRRILVILWPSFLVAILAEGLFFSVFDPHELTFLYDTYELPPIAIYTVGFLMFWLFSSLSASLTYYMISVPDEGPAPRGKRL